MYYYIHISERIYSDLCRVKRIFYRNPKPLNGHAPFFLAILDPLDKNERIYSDFYALFKPILAIIVGGLNRSDWVGMLRFQHCKEHKMYKKAESAYKLASYMVPSLQIPQSKLAYLYKEMGRDEEAVKIAKKILSEKVKIYSFRTYILHRQLRDSFKISHNQTN